MAVEVLMPKWGLTMTEGKITRWFKAEGDPVAQGEPLFEVETSKITNSVEAPATGILFQILVPAGETVPVKTVVAVIAQEGEQPERREGPSLQPEPDAAAREARKEEENGEARASFVRATPIARRLAKEWGLDLSRVEGTGPEGRITEEDVRRYKERTEAGPSISPQAQALAQKEGLDLSTVEGTGPDGKITKADVLRALEKRKAQRSAAPAAPGITGPAAGTVIPLEGMRKVIADNMMASLHQSAQLSVFVEVDATELKRLRDRLRLQCADQDLPRVSYNDLIAYAVCRAIKKVPIMNSWLTEDGIVVHDHVNLGIAVALPDGLIVPNVKNAQTLSVLELAREIRKLAAKAREGRLSIDEIQGGTFTITNVSMLGVDGFTPILNPPETGILGVGRAVEKPAVHGGEICVRTLMTLSLTFDHRVTDGAPAMTFLRTLADFLEDPATMIA
ncbi:MAG: pyruvate/2-oxoglutarate dehydrogenase complex, dihydrolipoamide acyltransferase component [Desulfacinum sp.]|nr:pyruvate/2-oxoglutarate dehydrogenase complex, dihydrolipoamide acyltransferase component [Desulfacinum sp.]